MSFKAEMRIYNLFTSVFLACGIELCFAFLGPVTVSPSIEF
jgi:hypothetical protein